MMRLREQTTPVVHRSAVVAADVMAAPGTVTCTKINGVGTQAAAEYYIRVAAVNGYGRTTATAGNVTVTTEGANLCIKAAFAAVAGATHYDIYSSANAAPLWVGRITAAQHASGIIIDAVGSTAAGGAVNSVYIYVAGTGLVSTTTCAVNTAYVPPTPLDCSGYEYINFDITMSRTGDAVAPALVVVPCYYNSRGAVSYLGTPSTLTFGGATGVYTAMRQRLQIAAYGAAGVGLLVQSIAGTGATVSVDASLS
jgi:hypothetical protein